MPKVTIENLALMTARGFEELGKKIDSLTFKVSGLEQSQEEVKSRLDQMAPEFEVKSLRKRVTKIEQHLGLN